MHKHRCSHCGTVWKHSERCRNIQAAHRCPTCNEQQWWQYWSGDEPATFQQTCAAGVLSKTRKLRVATLQL